MANNRTPTRKDYEAAARVIGAQLVKYDALIPSGGVWLRGIQYAWNPLYDNDDSFRLLCALWHADVLYPIKWSDTPDEAKAAVEEVHDALESGDVPRTRAAIFWAAVAKGRGNG